MDDLKKYLQNNREHIDTDMPGEELWTGVKNTLHPPARIPAFAKWMAAAFLVASVGIAAYFFSRPAKEELAVNDPASDTLKVIPPMALPPDSVILTKTGIEHTPSITSSRDRQRPDTAAFRRSSIKLANAKKPVSKRRTGSSQQPAPVYGFEMIEASYAAMLDMQLERVRTQPIYAEDPEYFHLFKKQFTDLANDEERIKQQFKQGYQEILLDELVTVYQRKITVLKQLQFEINKMNSKVKQTDAGIQLQKPSYINL